MRILADRQGFRFSYRHMQMCFLEGAICILRSPLLSVVTLKAAMRPLVFSVGRGRSLDAGYARGRQRISGTDMLSETIFSTDRAVLFAVLAPLTWAIWVISILVQAFARFARLS